MPGLTREEARDEALGILKGLFEDLWDSEKDRDFLKEVAQAMGDLKIRSFSAKTDQEKATLRRIREDYEESLKQAAMAKQIRLYGLLGDAFPKVISLALRIAAAL